jgi:hypothetical protein
VPGSFPPPYFYNPFVSQLTAHKYGVVVADLPFVGGKIAATMTDDAQAIQAVTSKVAGEGKDIVLIIHSYCGVPGTGIAHGVTKKEREALGKKGGVVALGSRWSRRWEKVPRVLIMSKSRYAVDLLPFCT